MYEWRVSSKINNKLCPHLYVYIELQKPNHNFLGHIIVDIYVHI